MDLPATMTTDQIADRLGLRFLKHPWGILPVSAVSGDGLQAALEWLAVRLGSNQVRPKTFASPLETKSPVACRHTLSSLSSSASSNATWRTESTKRRISKLGSFRGGSLSGPNAVPQKPVILLNSRLYRETVNGNTTSPSSGSVGIPAQARMSMSGESNPATRQTPQGAYHAQHRPSYYDLHQNAPRSHGSVVNCFSSYSISQSMREDLRGARKFSTISQSDIRRLSCASLTVQAAEGRRQSSVSLQERYNVSGNRKMSSSSLADGTQYRRKMSTTFIIDPPNYRKFSSASLMESPFARKYSDASLTDSLPGQRKMSSVSAVAALGGNVDTPPEEIRPNLSYLTVTPNIVATPPTGKRKSVDLALQGFGQFTPMMADYIYNGMKDSDTSADSLNLVSGSTGQSSGGAGATPSPSKDPAGHLRSLSMLRKSSLRVSKGRYTVNQPLSAAAAHPMVDQYTEELYRKMPEKYGSLAGRKPVSTQNSSVNPGAAPATGTDGGSDSGAEVLLPVPSRNLRRDSLLSPQKHGYDFTLPTASTITKTHATSFMSQERRQSRTPRKSSVSHERRHSKSLESLKGHGRRHSRSTGAAKEKDRRHSKSSQGRHERRQSKESERRHSKITVNSEERRHSKSTGRKRSRSGTSTEGEGKPSNSPGDRRQSKSTGILKDDRRYSRVDVDVILEERRSSNSSGIHKDRKNSKSPSVSPNNRRHSRSPAPSHGRRQSRGREIHKTSSNKSSSSSSSSRSRSSSGDNSRNTSCDSDSSASVSKNQRSSTFDLFTCSPIHKRWVLSYSCAGKTKKSHITTATNRFPTSVAPACMKAYSALRCLFFRPSQSEMRAETNSVSSDDDAEIEEADEKESEGDGDDEAEECDERREMLPTSTRSTVLENKLGFGYSLRARTEMDRLDDVGLPTCRVTVTVEEADEEEASSSRDDNTQEGIGLDTLANSDTDAAKQNSEGIGANVGETLKTQTSNEACEKKKLPLTAVDSGIQDNSPSMENYDSFTTDNSTDGPLTVDRVTPTRNDSTSKVNVEKVDLDLDLSDLGNDEIVLDSDLLVEIDECFDSVFHEKGNNPDIDTDSECNVVKDLVKSQRDRKPGVTNFGIDSDANGDEETASGALLDH
ncbi:hypothetical protein ElyMa_005942300 [Elysia marginata]|uniref:Uncharacterized protein n=1 Tax=Elysia marginata TaxID=1093978 RepID=A0AAV4G9C5_9GAST|nr:hypothetical protein ElyMa_005942300 [Elysia marginata]